MANDVSQFLCHSNRYPDPTTSVEVRETHISWIYLTDHYVYKLKKPVRFEFLDFSTPERRHEACQQELALNRRLAPDVYLEVVPVVRDGRGKLHLGGAGRPLDWTVKMVRLPAAAALDELVRARRLDERSVDQLGATLASFYTRLPPLTIRIDAYCRQFDHHIRANGEELQNPEYGLRPEQVTRVQGVQLRYLHVYEEQLVDRVRDGRVVDGHGDLRPEHIYLTPTPKIIDCIEFSAEFRTIDVADELAFLAMECDRLGAGWVGERVFGIYQRASGDSASPRLVNFFKCYRACVRAKVSALRAHQLASEAARTGLDAAREYLMLAETYAAQLGPPVMLLIHGISGTGKSTLAAAMAHDWGAELLQTDALRRELFDGETRNEAYNAGKYSQENRQRVYRAMFSRADQALRAGKSVVLDGTFLTRRLRAEAIQLANSAAASPIVVHCQCPAPVAMERVRERAAGSPLSEIRPDAIEQQQREEEADSPDWAACRVDTTEGIVRAQQQVESFLRRKWE